jgi:PUA domain protein
MKHLSGKDKKKINEILPLGYTIEKKDEIIENNDGILLKNGIPYLIKVKETYIPHLKSVNEKSYPICFIDNGAIPFLLKGADMMRPGIEKIEGDFEKSAIVLIKNQNYPKVIGVGFSELTSSEMEVQEKGKSVKIAHYIKDQYY